MVVAVYKRYAEQLKLIKKKEGNSDMRKRYFVPINFASQGFAFANVRWINLIETVIIVVALAIPIFGFLPLGVKGRIYLGVLVIIPAAIVTLRGVNDLSITSYVADVLETKKNQKIYGKPNNADRISRQRNLERKRHKQLKMREKEHRKAAAEEKRLSKKIMLRREDPDE